MDGGDPEIYMLSLLDPDRLLETTLLVGRAIVHMYLSRVSPAKLRLAVQYAWGALTPAIINAAGIRLFELLRYCEFPLPADMAERVVVWRGCRGQTIEQGAAGLSWSLSKGSACYAMWMCKERWGVEGSPLLIRATVPRSAIIAYFPDSHLEDVVFDCPPDNCERSGEYREWIEAAKVVARRVQHIGYRRLGSNTGRVHHRRWIDQDTGHTHETADHLTWSRVNDVMGQ